VGAANVTLLEHIPGLREVHSVERLLDQVVMALHIDVSHVSDAHRKVLEDIYGSTKALAGKRVLIVDDDIRNIFALSSVLEDYGMEIKTADTGRDAIAIAERGELDIVLMDIMMPEMDGLETTREIRKIPGCKELPIVAITAKAMKGDRERCIEAGAWDYLSKPVDRDQLLTVLKAWLQR
jgi:CheY-like chemotaxis protein